MSEAGQGAICPSPSKFGAHNMCAWCACGTCTCVCVRVWCTGVVYGCVYASVEFRPTTVVLQGPGHVHDLAPTFFLLHLCNINDIDLHRALKLS